MSYRWIQCLATLAAVAGFFGVSAGVAQETVTAHALVTAVTRSGENEAQVPRESVSVWENGKHQDVSSWVPLRGDRAGLELVLLLDDSSRESLSVRFDDLRSFIKALPPTTSIAVGYMRNGTPNLIQPFTMDHAAAAASLRLPVGQPGINGSPYFCLSSLIEHWPGTGNRVRREVIMVTDGEDRYWGRGYDPEDAYVLDAVHDAQRSGVVVYSIYFAVAGGLDRNVFASSAGQNYLNQVSSETGGEAYFQGLSNPVSLQPFLADIQRKLQNQYELGFTTEPSKDLRRITVKTTAPNTKLQAPAQIAAAFVQRP
jgi:hypothetical protein